MLCVKCSTQDLGMNHPTHIIPSKILSFGRDNHYKIGQKENPGRQV